MPAPEASVDKITYTLSRAEVVESLNQTLARSSVVQPPSPPPNGTHDSNETHAALGSVTAASYEHSRALSEANTLEALADSAFLCERQGRLAEAEGLYKQVISLSQQKFGQSHLSTAGVLSDLATLYQGQKRYSEAEPLLQRSLRIRTQVLRSNHQDIAETCSQLANVHRYQHRYDRAEPLFQHALTIFRQQLGPKHPRTQAVYDDLMHMLATVIKTGQYSKIVQKLPPLDLENLSDRYPWARPNWHR
ncbi:MAG: tetratricopeptide repeat protein [Cyanobacteria bacterium P01_D01_bin.105]